MVELLTNEIANEYIERARRMPDNGMQDAGDRRLLRIELQKRCNLTELVAINIINGFHVRDYVTIEQIKAKKLEENS